MNHKKEIQTREGVIIYHLRSTSNSTNLVSWVHDGLSLATCMQARVGHGLTFEILEYLPDQRVLDGAMSMDMRDMIHGYIERWQRHTSVAEAA